MTPDERLDHSPLVFGKYAGMTPSQIAESDPGYIVWMARQDNLSTRVSKLLVRECQQEIDAERN